jgi:hypothetical protein
MAGGSLPQVIRQVHRVDRDEVLESNYIDSGKTLLNREM